MEEFYGREEQREVRRTACKEIKNVSLPVRWIVDGRGEYYGRVTVLDVGEVRPEALDYKIIRPLVGGKWINFKFDRAFLDDEIGDTSLIACEI